MADSATAAANPHYLARYSTVCSLASKLQVTSSTTKSPDYYPDITPLLERLHYQRKESVNDGPSRLHCFNGSVAVLTEDGLVKSRLPSASYQQLFILSSF